MTADHSRLLPPSGANSWAYCSGSAIIAATVPNDETEASRKGQAEHWVGAQVLRAFKGEIEGPLTCDGYVGQVCPENGFLITPGMAEGAQVYVDEVLQVCQQHGGLRALLVEHRVHAPQIHEDNWGTSDTILPLLEKGLVYMWDAKFGHRDNRAKENYQLIDYMAGVVNELNLNGYDEQQITVVFRIVQPYCYNSDGPVNEWCCRLSDLRAYWNILQRQAAAITSGDTTFTTGEHCRDCNAVGRCSAARKASYRMFDYVNQPYAIDAMTGPELATEREALASALTVAKARLEAIDDDLVHRISQGEAGTGLVLEVGQGRQVWAVPVPQTLALAKQFGVDANKPGTLTPTQTTALVPKEMRAAFKAMLLKFTSRPSGKTKLVPASESSVAGAFRNTN